MSVWAIIKLVLTIILGVVVVGYIIWYTLRKAEDPARMAFRWILSFGLFAFMYFKAGSMAEAGGEEAAVGIFLTVICGLTFVFIWRHSIASLVAKPFAALYDGGDVPPEPRPAYSVAQARRKQSNPAEAILEIQKQLERFPTDFEGHMLMAEIQAHDLKDLPTAEATIQQWVAQPGHVAANTAFALYTMADWYLQLAKDRDGARRCLEQIIQALPDTEFALGAANRIAHLTNPQMIRLPQERKSYTVKEGVHNLGLLDGQQQPQAPTAADPAQVAGEYIKHLEQHPLDTEAREKLAIIYCDHYKRLDLASAELEQLISHPHQPHRMVVHWLNLLADLQVRSGSDYETARQTLERIIDRDPNAGSAQVARNRIDRLKLEFKTQQKSQGMKLGTYEQNIGLKQGSPRD